MSLKPCDAYTEIPSVDSTGDSRSSPLVISIMVSSRVDQDREMISQVGRVHRLQNVGWVS